MTPPHRQRGGLRVNPYREHPRPTPVPAPWLGREPRPDSEKSPRGSRLDPMQLLTYDDLKAEMEPTLALTHMGAFGDPILRRHLKVYRNGGIFAEYVGVFAVERL